MRQMLSVVKVIGSKETWYLVGSSTLLCAADGYMSALITGFFPKPAAKMS